MIDFIGDIHGHADKLTELLTILGYEKKNGTFYHSSRKVLFVGDYIDRGPQIKETLDIVKCRMPPYYIGRAFESSFFLL